mgnify:CR=1 FL=1|tara:strand:+ start:657 stop:1031 length:375 start_codon:yes stop_codon:yes gene_type:complete
MKIKITLLIMQVVKNLPISDPRRLKIYLSDDMRLPQGYMYTKDEKDTVDQIISKYLHVEPDWLNRYVSGFRKLDNSIAEVVYTIMMPEISGAEKSGSFFSYKEIERLDKQIDEYYQQLLSRKSL